MNNQLNYEYKFNKYINKYNNLVKQKGGMGYHYKFWNQHIKFNLQNDKNKLNLILNNDYNNNNTQFKEYSNLLKKLLTYENNVINFDFINNFFRYIYYDVKDQFSIKKILNNNKNEYEWLNNNNNNNKYNIINSFDSKHGNTSILFLENKNKIDFKVLKIFNNINININQLDDYLSLEIIKIFDNANDMSKIQSFQNNYFEISMKEFNKINFNKIDNFINEQNTNNKLYLCSKNNDAINDFIINIIIQQICEDNNKNINYVKYDNLFVTKINNEYKYCIIMEKLDGQLNNLENEFSKKDFCNDILYKTIDNLNLLKNKNYLFSHTDMKVENIFYKKENKIFSSLYNFYLADFDKSSISYKCIRFYNIGKNIDNKNTYFFDNHTIISNDNKYTISRLYKNFQNKINFYTNFPYIEAEQMYMRYNYIPYYMSFDIITLILSLSYYKLFDINTNIIQKYIFDDNDDNENKNKNIYKFNNLRIAYYNFNKNLHGNFGELLNIYYNYSNNDNKVTFLNNINNLEIINYDFINCLILSDNNKIILSNSFKPNYFKVNDNNYYFSNLNNLEDINSIIIEYSNDHTKHDVLIKINDEVCKTNRYSYFNNIFDYDNCKINQKDINNYFKYLNSLNKNNNIIYNNFYKNYIQYFKDDFSHIIDKKFDKIDKIDNNNNNEIIDNNFSDFFIQKGGIKNNYKKLYKIYKNKYFKIKYNI